MERTDMATADIPHGIDERRERQRLEARRAILDATEALVIESQSCDFSMRSLGRRSGYSAPTVYHYFGDKDGLIDALVEERLARLGQEFDKLPSCGDTLEGLRSVLLMSFTFWVSHPTVARLIWSVSSKGESRMPAVIDRVSDRVGAAVRQLAESGRLVGYDEETAGQMLEALLQGLILQRIHAPERVWSPQLEERAIDTLLHGMTHPAPEGDAS
ncbi:MAG: TetR/AcrR family transcriptional regulator [Deltaproteobacteria bacterium]|nr:TetR/AcrR family transcriptional regulator [Deltaproteobacteria bacterium]MBW2359519.1 TetR/AcrR family transcriptional regulator [Deltaproteobacteria bacterium]